MNVIDYALEILEERGWHQSGPGKAVDVTIPCAAIALSLAEHRQCMSQNDRAAILAHTVEFVEAQSIVRELVRESYGCGDIPAWNDDPATTEEDVKLTLKRASAILEERKVASA